MSDYSTDFVKKCATDEVYTGELVSPLEFDRWLNAQLADAWDESRIAYFSGRHENPYRKADS